MKDMQAHARKIRSDAAECLILSNLVTEERRHLFGRIAEHLNSLALEIEREPVKDFSDSLSASPPPQSELILETAAPADRRRPAARLSPWLPWLLLVVTIGTAGIVLGVNRTGSNSSNLPPNTASKFEASSHELAALLSEEREQRKLFSDQVGALFTRLDNLAKNLDDLKVIRAENSSPLAGGSTGQGIQSPDTAAKPSATKESDARAETNSSSAENPFAPTQTTPPAPLNTSPATADLSDQVGTIASARTELDQRKGTIGPVGCTHFRSFDPVSGTYTTFDGRRRPCR